MGGLSWWHWLIIGAAFILLFGAKKLPDAARGVGRSLRILKSEVSAMHEDPHAADDPEVASGGPAAVQPATVQPAPGQVTPAPTLTATPTPSRTPTATRS